MSAGELWAIVNRATRETQNKDELNAQLYEELEEALAQNDN